MRPRCTTLLVYILSLAVAGGMSRSFASAQDQEPNSSFAEAQVVHADSAGGALLSAELQFMPFEPLKDIQFGFHTLEAGQVNHHDFSGWPAGFPAAVYIDNAVGPLEPDTVMRALDETGNETEFVDDGSPLGNGLASGFLTVFNADGTLHLEVTGYADYSFDGIDEISQEPHQSVGEYALVLKPGPFGDVDFYRIVGLEPGAPWSAKTQAPSGGFRLDTILSQYDDAGALIAQNDDSDPDNGVFFSALSGIVPASGEVVLAVTSHNDITNVGLHLRSGGYGLQVTSQPVAEPASALLAAIGFVSLPFLRCFPWRAVTGFRPQSRPSLTD